MNNKKGFTLIELLAVIAVLGIIITIAVISVLSSREKSEKRTLINEGKALVKSAEIAVSSNPEKYPGNVCFSLKWLKENGYYDKKNDNYKGSVLLIRNSDGTLQKKFAITNSKYSVGSTGSYSNMIDFNAKNIEAVNGETNQDKIEMCMADSNSDVSVLQYNTKATITDGTNQIEANFYLDEDTDATNMQTFNEYIVEQFTRYQNPNIKPVPVYGGELRYVGSNPNSYVSFNGELWRAVGRMQNVTGGSSNTTETRVKLVKDEPLKRMAWDFKCTSVNTSNGRCNNQETFNNNWTTSSLKELLNDSYYNSTLSSNYYRTIDKWEKMDYRNTGIKSAARNMIDNATYYLGSFWVGSNADSTYYYNQTAVSAFGVERSGFNHEDYPATWTGKVGLLYPSDFALSAGGNDINKCQTTYTIGGWHYNCYENSWLFKNRTYWLINADKSDNRYVITSMSGGISASYASTYNLDVYPTVYLKSNVKVMGGTGTKTDPIRLYI